MKKYLFLIFALCVMYCFNSFSQQSNLYGPKVKNFKPWKEAKTLVTIPVEIITPSYGPKAKNQKPWKTKTQKIESMPMVRKNLYGPSAKNFKLWKDSRYEIAIVDKTNIKSKPSANASQNNESKNLLSRD